MKSRRLNKYFFISVAQNEWRSSVQQKRQKVGGGGGGQQLEPRVAFETETMLQTNQRSETKRLKSGTH